MVEDPHLIVKVTTAMVSGVTDRLMRISSIGYYNQRKEVNPMRKTVGVFEIIDLAIWLYQ